MTWTVNDVLQRLGQPSIHRLPAPVYTGQRSEGIFLGVESMKRHTTDEGWQIQEAMESVGYQLCGTDLPINCTNVPEILTLTDPGVVILQDKREWDVPINSFRDPRACFQNYTCLKSRTDLFKLTVLKDAHHNQNYHSDSAKEIGCHAWITYYHPRVVKRLAPYVREEHLIRTLHSVDRRCVPTVTDKPRRDCLLSGAVSGAYPLRSRLAREIQLLPRVDYKPHPGYHVRGCETPSYLKLLSEYKVAICTASVYGFTLRKLIEATACGCIVVTDLPVDDPLPMIDGNLVRVRPDISTQEMSVLLKGLYEQYDVQRQQQFAEAAVDYYDLRQAGRRLLADIEQMRRNYNATVSAG